jgi:hypothetical protein
VPSDPESDTVVTLAAVTDNVADPPAAIVLGLAEMVIEGCSCSWKLLRLAEPHPAAKNVEARIKHSKRNNCRSFLNRGTTGTSSLLSLSLSASQRVIAAIECDSSGTSPQAGLLEMLIGIVFEI